VPAAPRLILYHKQKTSARTRFLRFADGVLAFAPLPAASTVREEQGAVLAHPAAWLQEAETRLGLPAGALRAEPEFQAEAATPHGNVPVLLAECTAIDPPFAAAATAGGRFIAITEARDLPAVELELLRRAYEVILG
jgi:hypothetical protein